MHWRSVRDRIVREPTAIGAAAHAWLSNQPAIRGAVSRALPPGQRDNARLAGCLDEVALRGDDGWRERARDRRVPK